MKSTKLLILFCATFCINSITAKPTEPETSNETSNEQQRIIVDVNTQPEKQDPGMTDFLKNNNLTMEDLMKKQAILRDAAMSASTPQSDGTDDSVSSSQHREIHKA